MRIALVHPDLGLGGAERLVIDVAIALKARAHTPTIYTAHRDATRCFADVAPGREAIAVRVLRAPFPRVLFGRFHAILAALRCCALALFVCVFARPAVAVVDIVSLPVLVFALFRVPVLFYCHFPDKMLEQTLRKAPSSALRRVYRAFVDGLEESALRRASAVVCNSQFTRRVYCETYPSHPEPAIVYPCVQIPGTAAKRAARDVDDTDSNRPPYFLSLNRFERKKNVPLAIDAFAAAFDLLGAPGGGGPRPDVRLVVAGGFDARLPENVEHYAELEQLIVTHGLQDRISLQRNISDAERRRLMSNALAVVYTPRDEHFGIVPLEAMALGTPVVAADSGGPVETVLDGVTGRLCAPVAAEFGGAMAALARDPGRAREMGAAGAERVRAAFSIEALATALEPVLRVCCCPANVIGKQGGSAG
jgi:alpha-1,3/alpha-1,6-mannosyltransferase